MASFEMLWSEDFCFFFLLYFFFKRLLAFSTSEKKRRRWQGKCLFLVSCIDQEGRDLEHFLSRKRWSHFIVFIEVLSTLHPLDFYYYYYFFLVYLMEVNEWINEWMIFLFHGICSCCLSTTHNFPTNRKDVDLFHRSEFDIQISNKDISHFYIGRRQLYFL